MRPYRRDDLSTSQACVKKGGPPERPGVAPRAPGAGRARDGISSDPVPPKASKGVVVRTLCHLKVLPAALEAFGCSGSHHTMHPCRRDDLSTGKACVKKGRALHGRGSPRELRGPPGPGQGRAGE